MKKIILTAVSALVFSTAAHAQDASNNPGSAPVDAIAGEAPQVSQDQQPVDPNAGAVPQAPVNTTVIVPAARDAVTGEVVPTEVKQDDKPESLRDRVRSKLTDKEGTR